MCNQFTYISFHASLFSFVISKSASLENLKNCIISEILCFNSFSCTEMLTFLIPIRFRQAYAKQVCLWDLAQIIYITFIIQVARAI